MFALILLISALPFCLLGLVAVRLADYWTAKACVLSASLFGLVGASILFI